MKIPFINLKDQYQEYKQEIDSAIQKVLNSSRFIMGPEIFELEKNLSDYTGSQNVITCSSGTDALLLALMSIGIKPGDEIITSPFTFIATAEAISYLGATPVFVDIELETYNINHLLIEEKITSKTKAIMPVSLFGQVSDMDYINKIAEENNLIVIEDAAQSFGATYKNKKSCNLSTLACTSFFPAKPLGCYGDGGAVFTNSSEISEKIRMLIAHGSKKKYVHEVVGINGRMDTIQAAILNVKLKYFPKEIEKRHFIANKYKELIHNNELILPTIKKDRSSVFAQFTIRTKNRSKFLEKLSSFNIPTAIYYPIPLHLQKCYVRLGYKTGDFPISEKVAKEVFSIPMSPFLNLKDQNFIANTL
ncbi:MAG: aminotransferase DegT [Flavobacteriales bacterium]|nr:aminotransferase DegT [Flavobacteriales bacterium]